MKINLNTTKGLFNFTKKEVRNIKPLVGRILGVYGKIVKIISRNKFYVVVVNNPLILKPGDLVNLLFSNRQVTTPTRSQSEKSVEANLLFEEEIENLEEINLKEKNPNTQIKNSYPLLSKLFLNKDFVMSLTSLNISQIETLIDDLKKFASDDEIKTFKPESLEDVKKNLIEFFIRIQKSMSRWFAFPRDIRVDILKLYTGLKNPHLSIQRNKNVQHVKDTVTFKNSYKFQQGRIRDFVQDQKRSKEDNLQGIDDNFKRQNLISNPKSFPKQVIKILSGNSGVKPLFLKKIENFNFDKFVIKLPQKITELKSIQMSKIMKKNFGQITEKELKWFIKMLKFSISRSKNPKIAVDLITKNNVSKNTLINPQINHKVENLHLSRYLGNHSFSNPYEVFLRNKDSVEFSTQSFMNMDSSKTNKLAIDSRLVTHSSTNTTSSLKGTNSLEEYLITPEQETQLKSMRVKLSGYMKNQDIEKVIGLFRETLNKTLAEIKRLSLPLRAEIESYILRSSFEKLINKITTNLYGSDDKIKELKNLFRKFADKISISYIDNNEDRTFMSKIDKKRIFYSRIINSLSSVVGIKTIFLKFESINGRIDFIDKNIDPKIRKGLRLIFDLSFQNLGEVIIDTTINSGEVDVKLFAEKDTERFFQKNYGQFKEIFEVEGYHLKKFTVANIDDSKILLDEKYLLLTRSISGGNPEWIA